MTRATIPLAIGRGLDRATGLAAVQPQSPIDARNVYGRDAKMALRPGLTGTGFPPLVWGTDIIAIVPIRATLDELLCVFDRDSRELRIYRLDTVSGIMQTISSPSNGVWGVVNLDADFPVVTAAESDGLVFFAHDENVFDFRLPTIYYTPDFVTPTTVGTLTTLTADLDGDGSAETVYFRGVIAYLEYMWGWGFGSAADQDRGDILRFAKPTQPLVWPPANYFAIGVKKDPIISCIPTTGSQSTYSALTTVLAVQKESSTFRVIGTDPDTFGFEVLDAVYGTISSRVSFSIGGVAYTWASDGARKVLPGGTIPIAQPLELISPLPSDFPTLGPSRLAFAIYDQQRYLCEWVFPNSEEASVPVPSFALSLWNPDDPRWTFFTREQPVSCAGYLVQRDTGGTPTAPEGYVSDFVASDEP